MKNLYAEKPYLRHRRGTLAKLLGTRAKYIRLKAWMYYTTKIAQRRFANLVRQIKEGNLQNRSEYIFTPS